MDTRSGHPSQSTNDLFSGYHTAPFHDPAGPALMQSEMHAQAAIHSPISLHRNGLRADEARYVSYSSPDAGMAPSQPVIHAHDAMRVSDHHQTFTSNVVSPQSDIAHSGMPSNDFAMIDHAAQTWTNPRPQLNMFMDPRTSPMTAANGASQRAMMEYKIAQLAMYNMHYIKSDPARRSDAIRRMHHGDPIHLIEGPPCRIADRSNVSPLQAPVSTSTNF
jgi:hypothetical protein